MTGGGDVVELELRRVRLPLLHPHVTWAIELHEREVILVRAALEDGTTGWGECPTFPSPSYTSEYTDGAWALLRDILLPACFGPTAHSTVVGHAMATGALLDAVADARHRAADLAAGDRLLPWTGEAGLAANVPTATVVSGWADLDDLMARTEAAVRAGASLVKLKLGRDLDPLWALRSTFPTVLLAADLNGGYDHRDDADRDRLAEIGRLGLAYVEQPYPAEAGWAALIDLRGHFDTPIALDESIVDLPSAQAALMLGAASILNIKPARVGGTAAAAVLISECDRAGAGAFVGGMLETGVGRAHALAVAALPGCTLPTDLGPSRQYFAEDLTDPIERNADGTLRVPTGPGIGVEPAPDRLEAATVDWFVLRRS